MMNHMVVIIPISLLFFAFLTFLFGLWRRSLVFPLSLAGITVSLTASILGLIEVLRNGPIHYFLGGWAPPVGIEYVLDNLSAFMAVLVLSVAFLSMVYSRQSFLKEVPDKISALYPLLLLLIAGLAGIIVTGDLFNVYVFLEIASLTAYAVMGIGNDKAPVAVIRYVIIGTIGACFYLLGVGFLYFATGSLNMADVASILPGLQDSRLVVVGAVFIVLGMALKMALFPFHIWLPDVYSYAPSGVITFVAPLMTKVGAYVLIRMVISVFFPHYLNSTLPILSIVGWLAAAGIIIASVMAIAQKDLRRMLAYSSVAQICYVALGIGLANPLGLIGALLHILNHAFMKGCLFQAAGGISYSTGVCQIPLFSGLGRRMPWTMAAFTVAAISMVGIPPAAGFFSKWYLVLGSVQANNWVFVAVIVLSSLLNAVYFFSVLEKIYLKGSNTDTSVALAVDPPKGMLMPMVTMAVGIIVLGLINAVIITNVLQPITAPMS
jgi:multicomponent Na+:H+ antiporter subunit D